MSTAIIVLSIIYLVCASVEIVSAVVTLVRCWGMQLNVSVSLGPVVGLVLSILCLVYFL